MEALPDANDTILIVLQDGSSIRAEPYHQINVTEPADFVYGVGFNNRTSKEFRGKIPQSLIDSSATKQGSFICWSRDGSYVVFRENDYVEVTSVSITDTTGRKADAELAFGSTTESLIYPVSAEIYVDKLLNRNEFRALCDKYKTQSAILEALQNH